MEEIQLQQIKKTTTKNVLFLSLRNLGIQAVSTIGFFLLTILLGTGEVGLFAIVAETIGILGYFSDIGLSSALIQQKETPTKKELRTTFFVQQLLVFICLTAISFLYPQISHQKNYGNREFWIFVSLCFSFAAASLKTLPSVILERNLNFKLISTIDVIENLIFYIVAVVFAFLNFGAYSYAIANFARSLIGLIIIYQKQFWPIGFDFDFKTAKRLFSYGIVNHLGYFRGLKKALDYP